MKNVILLLADGFEEMEAIGTFALLRRAGLNVDLFALHHHTATGKFGLLCKELNDFSQLNHSKYDALVLPGGPGYEKLAQSETVKNLIMQFVSHNKVVAAICASPTILGKMGLLKGKNYTCFTAMNEDFGGNFTNAYATADGNIITGKSAAATVDFSLAVIEKLCGAETAAKVKASIYYKE